MMSLCDNQQGYFKVSKSTDDADASLPSYLRIINNLSAYICQEHLM